eukprot:160006_1
MEDAGDVNQMVQDMATEVVQVEPMNFEQALQKVIQTSLYHDGLARGLKEAVKALDRQQARLCILAESCDEPSYTKLVGALCSENSIPLVKVKNGKELGEWAGLCKIDAEGEARKVVGCSCVVIKAWGEESAARTMVLDQIAKA